LLKSKPVSNVVEFSIQTKELNFFYQPALTQEEIDEGLERPENVVGSYAVYHKTKKSNIVGGKHYRAGKAFHIYRPYAEDANGVRVWCELQIDEVAGDLNVVVPQSFLDTATYPVIVDPTIGYTTQGGTQDGQSGSEMLGGAYTATENGDVSKLTFYGRVASSEAEGVIYEDDGGGAGSDTIITNGEGDEELALSNSSSWQDLNYTTTASLVDTTLYIFCVSFNSSSSVFAYIFYDTGGSSVQGKREDYSTNSQWRTPPDPNTSWNTENDFLYSVYATYSLPITTSSVTKSLSYSVTASVTVQKSLQYLVTAAISAITKSLQYVIATKNYTREANASLPADNTNLSTQYSVTDVSDVSTDDATRVAVVAANDEYALHQYKLNLPSNTKTIYVKWNGQSNVAPSTSSVLLQIYNYNSTAWETLDTDSTSAADTDLTLEGVQSASLSNYHGTDDEVSVRVYQKEPV